MTKKDDIKYAGYRVSVDTAHIFTFCVVTIYIFDDDNRDWTRSLMIKAYGVEDIERVIKEKTPYKYFLIKAITKIDDPTIYDGVEDEKKKDSQKT